MKIRISSIPEEGTRFEFARKRQWLEGMLPADKRADFSLQEVRVDCLARKIRETVCLEMDVQVEVEQECSRCLEPATLSLKAQVKYTLAPVRERMAEEDPESIEEDLNFVYYREDEVEFDPIVLEQILMLVPVKPLCSDACRGLCPQCGANLNTETCNCRKETGHAGFAALKNFVVQR